MKKMLSVAVLGLAGIAIANAHVITEREANEARIYQVNTEVVVTQDTVKRTMIEPVDLPEAIHSTLKGDEYQGWTILSAFFVEPVEETSFYELTLQRVEVQELKVVKFDASGRVIE